METIMTMIAELGFPIAVTAYLLFRIENKLTQLTEAIGELKETIIYFSHLKEKIS